METFHFTLMQYFRIARNIYDKEINRKFKYGTY